MFWIWGDYCLVCGSSIVEYVFGIRGKIKVDGMKREVIYNVMFEFWLCFKSGIKE